MAHSFGERNSQVREVSDNHFNSASAQVALEDNQKLEFVVANSRLIVVQAFLEGADLERNLELRGLEAMFSESDWSHQLLLRLESGELDMAVYNRDAAKEYLAQNPNSTIYLGDTVGFSMGGRNFSILVRQGHRLEKVPAGELPQALEGMTVYVGVNTDRFANFLTVLGSNQENLESVGVRLMNMPDPPLSLLDSDPEGVLVCGQNTRFEALVSGRYTDIFRYEEQHTSVREILRSRSANCILISAEGVQKIGDPNSFHRDLLQSFQMVASSPKLLEDLVATLVRQCDYGDNNEESRANIARHVLFESYRMGSPIW